MTDCLARDVILNYVQGKCSRREREQIEEHLQLCPECRHRVDAARSLQETRGLSSEVAAAESAPATRASEGTGGEDAEPDMSCVTQPATYSAVSRPSFAGYEIVEELPRGGQAAIYKAIHQATKTPVALKVLLPGLLVSEKARRRFEQEVDVIGGFRHPYIVRIRDSGVSSGQYFFAMEYVRGMHLDRYVRAQGLSPRQIMVLFTKVCDAISYAHQHGVVHRDLKPSNILVDDRHDPLILDFGLAKVMNLARSGTAADMMPSVAGEIKGTLSYMSPEQAAGQTQEIDVRTDVYSLGVIMYRLLVDRFPYDVSGSTPSVLRNIESVEPKRPRTLVRRFDSDLETIILKCLAKNRASRYQSTAALLDDIRHWLNGEPLVARSQSSVYVIGKLMRRHKYITSTAALLLVIVLSFAFVTGYLYRNVRTAQSKSAFHGQQMIDLAQQLTPQKVFMMFLEAWHEDDEDMILRRAGALNWFPGKKEEKGVRFLLKRDATASALASLRASLGPEDRWFADLVVAELFLKQREFAQASAAYERCYRGMGALSPSSMSEDGLLRWLVAGRLRHLSTVPGAIQADAPEEERS